MTPAISVVETGQGQTVLFQHGLCGSAAQVAEVFPPGFRALTVESRGHGLSELGPPEDLSIAQFTTDTAQVLEARGLGPIVVGGISMGAAIALRLAVTRPDLVAGLILARPAWVTAPGPANMEPYALVGRLLQEDPSRASERFEASDLALRLAQEAPDNLASLRMILGRGLHEDRVAALLCKIAKDGPGVAEAGLAGLACPCLVLGHHRDLAHPWSHAQALARQIAGAHLVEVTPKASDPQAHALDMSRAIAAFLAP